MSSLTCLICNKCLISWHQANFTVTKNRKTKYSTILKYSSNLKVSVSWHDLALGGYLVFGIKPWIGLKATTTRLRREGFKWSSNFLYTWSLLRSVSHSSGISRKISEARFFCFTDWRKGFPCLSINWAAAVHYSPHITRYYRSTVQCPLRPPKVWSRHQSLETVPCQHYNLTTRPAASICRTCVFPSIRQHLTTRIHTFSNWFLVKLSSFSVTIKRELW